MPPACTRTRSREDRPAVETSLPAAHTMAETCTCTCHVETSLPAAHTLAETWTRRAQVDDVSLPSSWHASRPSTLRHHRGQHQCLHQCLHQCVHQQCACEQPACHTGREPEAPPCVTAHPCWLASAHCPPGPEPEATTRVAAHPRCGRIVLSIRHLQHLRLVIVHLL